MSDAWCIPIPCVYPYLSIMFAWPSSWSYGEDPENMAMLCACRKVVQSWRVAFITMVVNAQNELGKAGIKFRTVGSVGFPTRQRLLEYSHKRCQMCCPEGHQYGISNIFCIGQSTFPHLLLPTPFAIITIPFNMYSTFVNYLLSAYCVLGKHRGPWHRACPEGLWSCG